MVTKLVTPTKGNPKAVPTIDKQLNQTKNNKLLPPAPEVWTAAATNEKTLQ